MSAIALASVGSMHINESKAHNNFLSVKISEICGQKNSAFFAFSAVKIFKQGKKYHRDLFCPPFVKKSVVKYPYFCLIISPIFKAVLQIGLKLLSRLDNITTKALLSVKYAK